LEFEVNGRTVIQRAVGALAIIERSDVIEELGASVEAAAIDQLEFEGGPEAFHSVQYASAKSRFVRESRKPL